MGKNFITESGITGFVRVFNPNSHVRMSWKSKSWANTSTLQIRIIKLEEKTTIAIHQEKLLNLGQRDEMKKYWTEIMGNLINSINGNI